MVPPPPRRSAVWSRSTGSSVLTRPRGFRSTPDPDRSGWTGSWHGFAGQRPRPPWEGCVVFRAQPWFHGPYGTVRQTVGRTRPWTQPARSNVQRLRDHLGIRQRRPPGQSSGSLNHGIGKKARGGFCGFEGGFGSRKCRFPCFIAQGFSGVGLSVHRAVASDRLQLQVACLQSSLDRQMGQGDFLFTGKFKQ